ncbi:3553_t:CDS:2, partial [Acaulospora colombiana]
SSTSLPSPAMSRNEQDPRASSSYGPSTALFFMPRLALTSALDLDDSYPSTAYVVPAYGYPTTPGVLAYGQLASSSSHIQGMPITIPPVGSSTASSGYYATYTGSVVGAGGPVYVPTSTAGGHHDPLSLDYEALFPKSSSSTRPQTQSKR